MTNRSSVAPADRKRGDLALTKRFCGFEIPVGASWSSLTKDFKNGSGPCLHGTQDEAGTTKHNWSARCQNNVTGWVSMWAYNMLSL